MCRAATPKVAWPEGGREVLFHRFVFELVLGGPRGSQLISDPQTVTLSLSFGPASGTDRFLERLKRVAIDHERISDPRQDACISHSGIDQRKQTDVLIGAVVASDRDDLDDLVIQPRRCA